MPITLICQLCGTYNGLGYAGCRCLPRPCALDEAAMIWVPASFDVDTDRARLSHAERLDLAEQRIAGLTFSFADGRPVAIHPADQVSRCCP